MSGDEDDKDPYQQKHQGGFDPKQFDLGKEESRSYTGRWDFSATERFSRTGRFRKIKSRAPTPTEMEDPTTKIIVFPQEEAMKYHQEQGGKPRPQASPKPPIQFTAPLPKVRHLPEDFIQPGELDEFAPDLDYDSQVPPLDPHSHRTGRLPSMEFPQEERRLSDLLRNLENMAERYADNLFAPEDKTDWDEIERRERLIPGTDHEEGKRIAPSRQKVKKTKTQAAPPDMPPKELERRLKRWTVLQFFRRLALMILVAVGCGLCYLPLNYSGQWAALEAFAPKVQALSFLLGLGMLLCSDLLLRGLWRGFMLKAGTDTLGIFLGIFCGLDCFMQFSSPEPRNTLPLVPLVLLHYLCLAYGEECKRKAHTISCSVASKVSFPCIISTEGNAWQNRPVFHKTTGETAGFSSQIQEEDGVQLYYSVLTPVALIMSFFFSWLLTDSTPDFVWALTAFLLVSCPVGSHFLYGRASLKVMKRLKKECYATLGGWSGVRLKTRQAVISDNDLFPVEYIHATGASEFNGYSQKTVMSYTASLLKEGEVGCTPLFTQMMENSKESLHKCREVRYHDAGGISGKIAMDYVTIGGAQFTELMEVEIPDGHYVNNGIFCTINGELAGLFVLEYSLHEMVEHSLEALLYEGIRPILATRDFALTPEILRHRYRLPTGKMDFPAILRRYELSEPVRGEDSVITAVITRENFQSVTDCMIASKRLRQWVVTGLATSSVAAAVGFFLVAYLVSSSAYGALSGDNLLVYLGLWLVPLWLITDFPYKY